MIEIKSREQAVEELGKLGAAKWDNGEDPPEGYVFQRRPECPEQLACPIGSWVPIGTDRANEAARRAWCVEHLNNGGREVIASDYPEILPLLERAPLVPVLKAACTMYPRDHIIISESAAGRLLLGVGDSVDEMEVILSQENEDELRDVLNTRAGLAALPEGMPALHWRPISEYPTREERRGKRFGVMYVSSSCWWRVVSYGELDVPEPDTDDRFFCELPAVEKGGE